MAVHFRFLASKVFESVAVAGDTIPLRQLKDEIYNLKFRAALEKHRLKETFDFRVYDAESKDEIVGDQTRIWKHSRVIVKRVPAYMVLEVERERAVMQSDCVQQRSKPVNPSVGLSVEDGFGEDVFSASCVSSERSFSGGSATSNVTPIKLLEAQKLGVVSANRDARPKEVERPRVMLSREVVRVVKNCDLNLENLAKPRLESAEAPLQVEVPPELACFLCHCIMKDSVLIPCCCNSFCRKCITITILEQKRCPKCGLSKCKDSDLLPNRHINDSIQRFLNKGPVISNSVSASSDVSSEHGQPMSQSNKVVENHKPQVMAPRLPNVCEKRKMAPLCISLSGAEKPKMVAATASVI